MHATLNRSHQTQQDLSVKKATDYIFNKQVMLMSKNSDMVVNMSYVDYAIFKGFHSNISDPSHSLLPPYVIGKWWYIYKGANANGRWSQSVETQPRRHQ